MQFEEQSEFTRYRFLGAKWLSFLALVVLTPFSLNNFLLGRIAAGLGALAIVLIIAFYGWSLSRGREPVNLGLYVLTPFVIIFLALTLRDPAINTFAALWCYPAVVFYYIILPEKKARLANAALLIFFLPQAWYYLDHVYAYRLVATLMLVSLLTAVFVRVINVQQKELQRLATTDNLTGLYNRTLLQSTLEEAVHQSRRSDVPQSLLALDLDKFKSINDDFGHGTGDEVLRQFGRTLRSRLRVSDKAFRLGGEEFVVLLYDTALEGAQRVGEDIRKAVEAGSWLEDRSVTVSIGVAALAADDDVHDWLKRADDYLYQAKHAGRNRVIAV